MNEYFKQVAQEVVEPKVYSVLISKILQPPTFSPFMNAKFLMSRRLNS